MSNGWTDSYGAEVSRNSSRGGSPDHAVSEARKLGEMTDVLHRALENDGDFQRTLKQSGFKPHDWRIILEETARMHLENDPRSLQDIPAELPSDWKTKVLRKAPHALMDYMCRAR